MPLTVPPELKKITPFVRRAEELDKDKNNPESRLVAYYCRQYAVHTGIPLAATSANAKVCLGSLLEALEQEKPAMDNFTKEEAKYVCTEFANKVFNKANEEDVNGAATKDTAKTFYAAASFLQILGQFNAGGAEGEESEEEQENKKKMLYAKWKATEILKAIKEGRTPTPGGYEQEQEQEPEIEVPPTANAEGMDTSDTKDAKPPTATSSGGRYEDDSNSVEDVTPPSVLDLPPPAPSTTPPTIPPPAPVRYGGHQRNNYSNNDDEDSEQGTEVGYNGEAIPPPAYPGPPPPAPELFAMPPPPPRVVPTPVAPPPAEKKSVGGVFGFGKKKNKGGKVSKSQLADAVELTKFALVALEDKNTDVAAERLQQALQVLGR